MAQPYIGEIRLFAGNYAPAGWAFCNGQLMPISENDALFVVLGTRYGGDGQETFALPDLRGRVPVHQGTGPGLSAAVMGESAGVEDVTLTMQQIPNHSHALVATGSAATDVGPVGSVHATTAVKRTYTAGGTPTTLALQSISPAGGSQPHPNMQPFLGLNYIISLFGLFPSQT